MWKKPILSLFFVLVQMLFIFAADQSFRQGMEGHVSRMRQNLPAEGMPPNQVDALAGVIRSVEFNVSGHILLVGLMLIIFFNTAAVSRAFRERE